MRKKRHPLSGAIYQDLGNGRVRVNKHGVEGTFDAATARWLAGALTHADPHMLLWVGGKALPPAADSRRPGRSPDVELVHD